MHDKSNDDTFPINNSQHGDEIVTIEASGGENSKKVDEEEEDASSKINSPKSIVTIAVAVFCGIAVVVGIVYTTATTPRPVPGVHFPASSSVLGVYRFASVAADAGRCSQIGADLIAKGGSAVDGAIAATICTGVYNMHNAGIGGGFFMTIWDQATQSAFVVDAREMAPLNSTEDMFDVGNVSSTLGPYAIAVPGEVAGYWAAHQRFGQVPWSWLFEPTIKLCTGGFPVSHPLKVAIDEVLNDIENKEDKSPFRTLYDYLHNPATHLRYAEGDNITCPTLAKTFERIAQLGAPDYYNGSLAMDILADLHEVGSPINQTDLSEYHAIWRKPVEALIQNKYQLYSTPPPSSGAILAYILNILSGYNFTEASASETLSYHRFVEALKFAYAKRTYFGDESFVSGLQPIIDNMTSPVYGNYIRSLINDTHTHPTAFYAPDLRSPSRTHGTSHISALDARGNAVAVTSTINTYFGSGIMGSRTGIIFNDEMDDFSSPNETNSFNLPPSTPNFIKPGKRPQSSTAPCVFLVKDPNDPSGNTSIATLVTGAAGGSRITSGTAYVAMRVLWFKENVKQAIDALRLHHQLIPEELYYEPGMPSLLLDDLYGRGHVNQTAEAGMSIAQAIQRLENGTILANSDFRKRIAFPDGF